MAEASSHDYLIALGSNRRHHRIGAPAKVLEAALLTLAGEEIDVLAIAPVIHSRPIGPSRRSYANGAATIRTGLAPDDLLALLKATEAWFGVRRGQRWGPRTLDLDIILWSGGIWSSRQPDLAIPHRLFRERRFVLDPAVSIAPRWRDPVTGLTMMHLLHRCTQA